MIRRVLDESEDPISRARVLGAYVDIVLASGDACSARVASASTMSTYTPRTARSRDGILGLVEDPANHRVGCLQTTFGEPQQREPGLRLVTELVCVLVGGIGSCELADEAFEVAFEGPRAAERSRVHRRREPVAHVAGFIERLGPRALQAEDFHAVQEAVTTVEHELLLRVAPPRERLRPRAASRDVDELGAHVDHSAVPRPRLSSPTARGLRSTPSTRRAAPCPRQHPRGR